MSHTQTETCLNCGRSEAVMPLIALRYQGVPNWICSQCMPQLIHQPQALVGKLANAASIPAAPAD